MNDTNKIDEIVNDKELNEQEQAALVQALEQLKAWQQNVFLTAIAGGIKDKYDDMLVGQGLGKVKNNNYNKGYMGALRDIYHSMCLLLDEEGLKIVQGKLAEENQRASNGSDEDRTDEQPEQGLDSETNS